MASTTDRTESQFTSPALVIVDMQNDFVRPGAPMEVPDARDTIPANVRLIATFRKLGAPIVFTRFLSTPAPSLLWRWSPQCAPPTCACHKGFQRHYDDIGAERDGSEIIDELGAAPSDLRVEKYGYGAFHDTSLRADLIGRGIRAVVVTGTVTQICVEETAREAFHHGFMTTIAADAVSSFAADLHAATLKNFQMKFGWVMDSSNIIHCLVGERADVAGPGRRASHEKSQSLS